MAELYFNECRKKAGRSLCGASCGIAAADGSSISDNARKVMELCGIDASNFKSTQLTPEIIANADPIYTMTQRHADVIKSYFPEARVETLLDGQNVSDPFGGSLQTYLAAFDMMKAKLELLASTID